MKFTEVEPVEGSHLTGKIKMDHVCLCKFKDLSLKYMGIVRLYGHGKTVREALQELRKEAEEILSCVNKEIETIEKELEE